MARVWNEQLEAIGYDETWSQGETIDSGNTLDEDFATASVPGAPADWGSLCLASTNGGTGSNAFVRDDSSLSITGVAYWRSEFILDELPTAGNQIFAVLKDQTDNKFIANFIIESAPHLLQIEMFHDGASNRYRSFAGLAIDTRYRVEVKVDFTNNVWAWRLDGVDMPNDVDASDPVTSEGTLTSTHPTHFERQVIGLSATNRGITIFYDNIAVDDADWVGAEVPETTMIGPGMMMGVGT